MARPTALAYHAVTDTWPHALAVTTDDFRAQMHRLARRGFRGITVDELMHDAPSDAIAITFDDGLVSVGRAAKPILDELGWRATVFVVTDAVGGSEPLSWLGGEAGTHDAERRSMDWDAIGELADAGWGIGSHTRTHHLLSSLPDDALEDELVGSREAVSDRIGACTSISYPYGELDDRVVAAASAAGYTTGLGLAGRFVYDDPLRIPRVAIANGDERLRFAVKTSSAFGTFRRTSLWTALDCLRRPGRPFGG